MKLSKLIAFSLLVTLNAVATELESETLAPPPQVEEYLDFCFDPLSNDADTDEYTLNCVNALLKDSGFKAFSSYEEMVAYMNREDDE